ncbi:hypothetical protein [Ascidiaceihabitans sp.]|uniref:hypothetical protein n=1 Tax=Ascidiaceihabitans sp. TaxID=1872644 RepID=UPI003297A6F8
MPSTSVFTMAAMCLEYMSAKGYDLEDCTIDLDLADQIEGLPSRNPIQSILSPAKNDFNSNNSFWLIMRKGSEIVGTLGARFDNIGDNDVGMHLAQMHSRHFPRDSNTKVMSNLDEDAAAIKDGLIYMGDVFFAKEHRGDFAKTQCFCQYAFCLAYARWWHSADWIIALHRQTDALNGKVLQHGFTSTSFPAVQNWLSPPHGRSGQEYLSGLSKPHFLRNIRRFIENPDLLVDPIIPRR